MPGAAQPAVAMVTGGPSTEGGAHHGGALAERRALRRPGRAGLRHGG